MSLSFGQVLLILLIVGVAVGTFFLIRRQRYVRSLRAQGWTFEGSPTLTTTYGDHRVNRFDTSLQRFVYRLTKDYARSFTFQWHLVKITFNRAFAINRLTECIYHAAKHTITNFN